VPEVRDGSGKLADPHVGFPLLRDIPRPFG